MAECRRVQLTTLAGDVPPAATPQPQSGAGQAAGHRPDRATDTDTDNDTDTVRLLLTLFEPDERSFPEFSYSQLVDSKINHAKGPLNRFEEEEKRENDEAAAIIKKLEEKYGGKPKIKDRIQDLIDIGYGYDEEDSFIDNSEAYDEFVPASITTKFGGFYVNSGVLHFRQASDTEDLTTAEKTTEPTKKRNLNVGLDKPKSRREDGDMKSNKDPKSGTLSQDDKVKKKKKKKAVGTLSVTSMLKKFQREKEKERQKLDKANQKAAALMSAQTIPLCPADAAGGGGSGLTDPLLSLIGSTNDHALIQAANTVDFDIDLDSLLDVSEGTLSPKLVPQPAMEIDYTQVLPPNTNATSQPKPHSDETSLTPPSQCIPLPDGLPPGLADTIRKLAVAAKTSEGESKLKFFTPEINSILLEIELQCREQGGQLRSKVYTHLSSFLPCSRDTLLKRVKKLLLSHVEEPPDMEDPMHKLREAIGKAMPEQIARFHENCQVYEQGKTSKAMEREKEGKQKVNPGPEENMEEKVGKRGGPKKLFKWNEEIRQCLCNVLKEKMERYQREKGSQELEEYLKTLLDNEVKPVWPKGWMQSRALMRESRNILSLFMSLPVKKARPEKKQPVINGVPTASDGCSVLRASPPMKGLQQGGDNVSIEKETLEGETREGVSVNTCSSKSAQNQSLLDLLADQALAREQPLSVSQELLAAAITKYKRSVQHWSLMPDTRSPPLPPPPPQSSPVGFPVSGVCQVVLPQLLQIGDFARHMNVGQAHILSDDSDVTMQ